MTAPAIAAQAAARAKPGSLSRRLVRRKVAAASPSRETLAAEFLALCELDPGVDAVEAGGVATLIIGEEAVSHEVDFAVIRQGVKSLVDIVADADLPHHPLAAALVAGDLRTVDGHSFAVETSATIRAEPRYTTMKLILACRRTLVSAGDRVRILHHLSESGTAPLVECAAVVQNAPDGVAAVLALVLEGLIEMDITRPILPETPLRRRKLPRPET